MSVFANENLSREYVYDFSVDGGAQGDIELSAKAGYKPLPEGAVVKNVWCKVDTLFASTGAATLSWGDGSDVDGYSGTAKALAALVADAAFDGKADSGALLPGVADSDGKFTVTIATEDMSAGKAYFRVDFFMPGKE